MSPIQRCVEAWHRFLRGEAPGGLDALLADDVVFHSPIVFTPQKGRDLTKLYLTAAATTFGGGEPGAGAAVGEGFRYTKEVLTHPHAVLEFEVDVDGTWVNGVDILTCDEEARIVAFKVMLRPLRAVQLMHRRMAALLEETARA